MRVAILGGTGMLGDAVVSAFKGFAGEVIVSTRNEDLDGFPPEMKVIHFEAGKDNVAVALDSLEPGDYIINCIGIIKTAIDEKDTESRKRAVEINSRFPSELAKYAELRGLKAIQIATDCVFSGKKGSYSETDPHDPVDLYGATKSAGEIKSASMMHLRVSIIGREKRGFTSLFEWVARQKPNAQIAGFTNHFWNGIPAIHFGKLTRAIVEEGFFEPGVHHILPKDTVTKAELVRLIANHVGRNDISIVDGLAPESVDRTLTTNNQAFNAKLWAAASRVTVPSVAELVAEI
jgi:dTDP-4-dehydrorhamnose reductase